MPLKENVREQGSYTSIFLSFFIIFPFLILFFFLPIKQNNQIEFYAYDCTTITICECCLLFFLFATISG